MHRMQSRHPLSQLNRPPTRNAYASSSNPNLRAIKSHSTSQLPVVANAAQQAHDRSRSDTAEFNTLPRTPTPQSNGARTPSTESNHHPDLTNEVATLSTKLINAINHQTNLDDSLQSARHDLETARARIAELESATQQHEGMVQSGVLVRREHADKAEQVLKTELAEERLRRTSAEKDKKKMELELERLTSELFEEANSMVADARRQKQEAEQQKEQYQAQLRDAEVLLASHQEQLRELKDVMQQLHTDERVEELVLQPSAPSTPVSPQNRKSAGFSHQPAQHQAGMHAQTVFPDHPLAFSNLISPVLRSDIQSYDEFYQLLKLGSGASPSSRASSGNFAGLNVMGLGSLSHPTQSKVDKQNYNLKSSNSSLSTSTSAPQHMPGSFNPNSPVEVTSSPSTASSLKEAKYYKRAITEDVEPTLRLDTAPGLSWLARRGVLSSMAAGNLIVEPFPPGNYSSYTAAFPCGLCGEVRDGEIYVRRHRFRTSDNDDAQRYPICDFCVGRLRATADFVNFLRMVRSGYWRGESVEEARLAWEECVRLRERMFWARLGGGVIPTAASYDSPSTPRRMRHAADQSVSSTYLDDPAVAEPVNSKTAPEESAPRQQQTDAVPSQPKEAQPAPQTPDLDQPSTRNRHLQEKRKSTAAEDPAPPLPRRTVPEPHAPADDSRPKSRGTSVEALRSRFESRAGSGASDAERPGSALRAKSRTPSPRKQSIGRGVLPAAF